MEQYTCPICKRTTYTAYRDVANICPYCNTEKILIFNPNIFTKEYELTDAKIIFDRRNTDILVEDDRRKNGDSKLIPLAWLVIKQRHLDQNKT